MSVVGGRIESGPDPFCLVQGIVVHGIESKIMPFVFCQCSYCLVVAKAFRILPVGSCRHASYCENQNDYHHNIRTTSNAHV
jgi:hypothetical protein